MLCRSVSACCPQLEVNCLRRTPCLHHQFIRYCLVKHLDYSLHRSLDCRYTERDLVLVCLLPQDCYLTLEQECYCRWLSKLMNQLLDRPRLRPPAECCQSLRGLPATKPNANGRGLLERHYWRPLVLWVITIGLLHCLGSGPLPLQQPLNANCDS